MKKDISNLEDHLGYWLRALSNAVSHSFAEKLETRGISVAQWVVLRTLYDVNEISLNDAAQKVGVDKSTMSRMIERLVQKSLVIRIEGLSRRELILKLTISAKNLVPKLAKIADDNDKLFFKSLNVSRQKELLTTIKDLLIANNLEVNKIDKQHSE